MFPDDDDKEVPERKVALWARIVAACLAVVYYAGRIIASLIK